MQSAPFHIVLLLSSRKILQLWFKYSTPLSIHYNRLLACAHLPVTSISTFAVICSFSYRFVLPSLGHHVDSPWCRFKLQTISFWMPYVPCSLIGLLSSTDFSPHPLVSIFAFICACRHCSACRPLPLIILHDFSPLLIIFHSFRWSFSCLISHLDSL